MPSTVIRELTAIHPSLRDDADVLSGYVVAALAAVAGFVVLNTVLTTIYIAGFNDGVPTVPPGVQFLASGIALLAPVGIIWWRLGTRERTAAFPFRKPSATEVGWAFAFVPIGVAASTLGIEIASTFGFEYVTFDYDLTNPVTAVGVLLGPILLAPVLEEALFRGLLLGALVDRGWSPVAAGIGTIAVFAGLHVWLGVAGMVGIAVWTVFPTILRLKFDDLTGAFLLHLFNNVYSYVVVVALSI